MMRALAVLLSLAAAPPALAQVAGPTPGQIVAQQQANQNRFQAQMQANQLQDLKQRNTVELQNQVDPNLQAESAVRRQQIQQQIDENTALQQQMSSPGSNPADAQARLQHGDVQIQQLQQQQRTVPLPR
jgi:hypothetical protein